VSAFGGGGPSRDGRGGGGCGTRRQCPEAARPARAEVPRGGGPSRALCVSKMFCKRALFVPLYASLLLLDVKATTVEAHNRLPALDCGSPSGCVCVYVTQQQTTAAKRLPTRMTAPQSGREACGAKAVARQSIVNNEMLSPYLSHVAQRVPLST